MSDAAHSTTADRLDDLGIGILAAPYAADVVANLASKHPRLHGLQARATGFSHKFHARPAAELAGLALVAPGVVNPLAEKIDSVTKKSAAYRAGYTYAHTALGLY